MSVEGAPTYRSLGVTPLINCKGTFTSLSGSLLLPESQRLEGSWGFEIFLRVIGYRNPRSFRRKKQQG